MQQVKIFVGNEDQKSDLEKEVNDWIASSGATVTSIVGNIAPQTAAVESKSAPTLSKGRFASSDVLLIVLYEA